MRGRERRGNRNSIKGNSSPLELLRKCINGGGDPQVITLRWKSSPTHTNQKIYMLSHYDMKRNASNHSHRIDIDNKEKSLTTYSLLHDLHSRMIECV